MGKYKAVLAIFHHIKAYLCPNCYILCTYNDNFILNREVEKDINASYS